MSASKNDSRPGSPAVPQPDDDEDTITMLDVLEDEAKLQEEASAVLGNSDGKNCTYSKGYIPRQALYSCATCSTGSDDVAAICLACSLECHENHQVYELYTKRNYRCDCGNSKFKQGFECKLEKQKLPLNDLNKYNHNFSGRYCVCDTSYPPEEGDEQDDMLQCVACEDWFHTNHLDTENVPDKFEELICGPCADRLEFVRYYSHAAFTNAPPSQQTKSLATDNSITTSSSDATAKVSSTNGGELAPKPIPESEEAQDATTPNQEGNSEAGPAMRTTGALNGDTADPKLLPSGAEESQVASPSGETANLTSNNDVKCCRLESLKQLGDKDFDLTGTVFWPSSDWRKELCRCDKCMDLYKEKDCAYLLDEKDTVLYYEAQGKANNSIVSQYEQGMSALGQMNRVAVVEALHSYNSLKADLSEYLRKFADNKKIVREEDIHEFFEQMKQKKRQKVEMTEFCR